MFLIENHHRETVFHLAHELSDAGHGDWANKLYAILPDFIPHKPNPEIVHLTDQQQSRLWKKWNTANQGLSYPQFLIGVEPTIGMAEAVAVQWCGMWLCIETNGECHS